jgi:cytochrome c peroxidase
MSRHLRILFGDPCNPRYTLPMLSPFCARTIMARRYCYSFLFLGVLLLTSCQKANRFPTSAKILANKTDAKDDDADLGLYRYSWVEPGETRDLPLLFVADSSPEWQHLPAFWTHYPLGPLHLGQQPLQALTAVVLTDHLQAIKIKVPRGLPDPTEHFPKSNPPTYGKWRLGQALFHEAQLQAEQGPYACATCHKPEQGFAARQTLSPGGKYNTLSLINVAYNRRQFWDGRVETLEETLVRGLADERAEDPKRSDKGLKHHNWGGFVRALVGTKRYDKDFQFIFGIDEHPTQDAVAQALATYMRTILSGDSLYDRADQIRKDKKAGTLTADHFLEPLKDARLAGILNDDPEKKFTHEQLSVMLARGHELFHTKARCAQCHKGPLFTDHDFHNVGYEGKEEAEPDIGAETGRAVHVPVDLKQSRFIGAFRTPTLRNLVTTEPYFHNGTHYTLPEVVKFYDEKILPTSHLAKALKDGDEPQRLNLNEEEKNALVMFLRALEGTPVDPIVMKTEK